MLCCAAGRGAAARVPGGRTTRPAVSVPRLRTPPAASGTSERARAHAWHRSCRWVPIGRRQSRSARTDPVHDLLLTAPRVDRVRCSQVDRIHAKNTCSVASAVVFAYAIQHRSLLFEWFAVQHATSQEAHVGEAAKLEGECGLEGERGLDRHRPRDDGGAAGARLQCAAHARPLGSRVTRCSQRQSSRADVHTPHSSFGVARAHTAHFFPKILPHRDGHVRARDRTLGLEPFGDRTLGIELAARAGFEW